jgi:hypothetical protein
VSTAQTWAALGVLAAALAIMITLVLQVIDAKIGRLDAKIDGLRQEMVVRFDSIDRDLQRLYEHVFHRDEPSA